MKNLSKHLFTFFILTTICISTQQAKAQCHIDDWTALKAFYVSTDGDNWNDNSGWEEVTGTAPSANCNLEELIGITLNDNGRVKRLIQSYNGIGGSLPSELTGLTYLETFRVESTDVGGSIPPEIGSLTNLTGVDLSHTQLSGNIPPQLGNLTNLEILTINNNQFTGGIPAEFGNLTSLFLLNLSNNQLSGSIPPQLGNLTNLSFLYLHNNQLIGGIPAEFGNIGYMNFFQLHHNNLSGCYPANVSMCCERFPGDAFAHTNSDVSDGNNFDVPWEDFCNTGAGECSCISDLIINGNTPFQNLYQSNNTITTQGTVIVQANQQVEYRSNRVRLNQNFKVQDGANFKVRYGGCN